MDDHELLLGISPTDEEMQSFIHQQEIENCIRYFENKVDETTENPELPPTETKEEERQKKSKSTKIASTPTIDTSIKDGTDTEVYQKCVELGWSLEEAER